LLQDDKRVPLPVFFNIKMTGYFDKLDQLGFVMGNELCINLVLWSLHQNTYKLTLKANKLIVAFVSCVFMIE
jgi:hypothetical protein